MTRRRVLLLVPVLLLAAIAGVGYRATRWAAFERVEGKYFDSAGVRIHYVDEGQGEPLVLVHGMGMNIDTHWRRRGVLGQFAREWRVIALDCRGHGLSDKPRDPAKYGAEMAEDIVRLMDHLGIAKARVLGYSMGGFISLKLLTLHPDRLVCALPCAAGFESPDGDARARIDALAASLESGQGYGPLAKAIEPGGGDPAWWKVWLLNKFLDANNDELAIAAVVRGMPGLEVTEAQLKSNPVPALAICGSADPLRTGIDAGLKVAANYSAHFIDGADHTSAMFHPEFIETARDFLRAHTGASADPAAAQATAVPAAVPAAP